MERHVKASKNTTIQFGLVMIPVGVVKATEDSKVSLKMASDNGLPVEQRFVDTSGWQGKQTDCKKGVFLDDGTFREVDFSQLDPELPEALEVLDTLPRKDVDFTRVTGKCFLQSPAAKGNPQGYALLAAALKKSKRAAVTEYCARSVTQPAVIIEEDGVLVLCTLTYHADQREPDALVLAPTKIAVKAGEVELANKLLDAVTTGTVLETLENKALPKQRELVNAVLAGETREVKARKKVDTAHVGPDLMDQLAASLAATEKVMA